VWQELLSYIEFAYNKVVNTTASHTPFEIVYGFNPLTPLDLFLIPYLEIVLCKDKLEKTSYAKDLHQYSKDRLNRK